MINSEITATFILSTKYFDILELIAFLETHTLSIMFFPGSPNRTNVIRKDFDRIQKHIDNLPKETSFSKTADNLKIHCVLQDYDGEEHRFVILSSHEGIFLKLFLPVSMLPNLPSKKEHWTRVKMKFRLIIDI